MTLPQAPFFTGGGAQHSAEQVRLMIARVLGNAEGISGPDDCAVFENLVPDSNVRITDGGVSIRGRVQASQGVYTAYNVGDELVPVPATGGTPRNDLLVLRVEDPTYEGTLDPVTDNIIYPLLVSNVPAGTETLADAGVAGLTALPLARLEIPASTATILDNMIFDVRRIARPRTESFQDSVQNQSPDTLDETSYVDWPAGVSVSTRCPTWANRCDVAVTVFSVKHNVVANGQVHGKVRIVVNGGSGDSEGSYNNDAGGAGDQSFAMGTGATFNVAQAQGQTVTVNLQALRGNTNNSSRVVATTDTSLVVQLFFRETTQFNT